MNLPNHIATYSGILAGIEIGLGAWIHALHLPLGGQILSLNQGFLLSLASKKSERKLAAKAAYGISSSSALLKSLSPMGKRLTPMLAIWMQGVLFSMGVLFGGTGVAGLMISSALLSLWSFIQPALFAFFIFGADPMGEWVKLFPNAISLLTWIIAGAVILKVITASLLALIAVRISDSKLSKYLSLAKKAEMKSTKNKWGHWVWIGGSVVIGLALFFIQGENTVIAFTAYVLRPLAASLVLFYLGGLIARLIAQRSR